MSLLSPSQPGQYLPLLLVWSLMASHWSRSGAACTILYSRDHESALVTYWRRISTLGRKYKKLTCEIIFSREKNSSRIFFIGHLCLKVLILCRQSSSERNLRWQSGVTRTGGNHILRQVDVQSDALSFRLLPRSPETPLFIDDKKDAFWHYEEFHSAGAAPTDARIATRDS